MLLEDPLAHRQDDIGGEEGVLGGGTTGGKGEQFISQQKDSAINMKISWCQADVDKWSSHFGRAVDVESRLFLQSADDGHFLTLQGGRVVGKPASKEVKNDESKGKHQVYVIVRVPRRGVLLVNETTGAHIVAKGVWTLVSFKERLSLIFTSKLMH